MRLRFRQAMAILLMIVGVCMLARGLAYSVRNGLGWQGILQAGIIGFLVFALGFARWRYLRQR
jgi:hypothetical protein